MGSEIRHGWYSEYGSLQFITEKLGLSEEQMFKLAVENTRRIFPPTVKSMNDVVRDMFMKDVMPAEIADMMIGELPKCYF